jgi:hypothetical protein
MPPGPVIRTETVPPPLGPGGTTAFIALSKTTVKEVAGVEPKVIAVAFVKPKPMIDTVFPPATEPLLGFTKMMRGGLTMLEVFGRLPLVPLPLDALTDVAPAIARYWRGTT